MLARRFQPGCVAALIAVVALITLSPNVADTQGPKRRKAIAREFQEFIADKLYWNTISGSPFYEVAQPWMKDYSYNAEWKILSNKVWLDK